MINIIHLQEFYVFKLPSSLIEFKHQNIDISSLNIARKNKWLVSLADSQALRTIRRIRQQRNPSYIRYDDKKLGELKKEKKRLLRGTYNKENVEKIKTISQQIDEMLLMPEYIIINIECKTHYLNIIRNGLYINGSRQNRLLCGAGHARNNNVVMIREDFEKEVKLNLQNDFDKNIYITDNKYNAQFALSSTATYLINDETHPELTPKVILIDDCEIKMNKKVDWVEKVDSDNKYNNKNKIVTCNKELEFNLFDGGGLIDITAAKKWAEKLELDYIPSVFIIRNIFIKGCLFTVDFKKFAKNIANKSYITDLYGNNQYIENADIILSKSQFKLYNAYESMEQYQKCCDKYQNYWGVARISPKNDDNYVTTNYQFLQVLNMENQDIKNICSPTENWLKNVSGMDRNISMLFLMGNLSKGGTANEVWDKISDNVVKALAINPKMINDDFIRQKLVSAINKKVNESYIGKLIVKGCFSTMIPDPYAMMQWACGVEVTGLLKDREHYSFYWNNKKAKEAIACRSPLTWRSEVNKLNFIKTDETEEWYKYLNSGIVYNVWGVDCMLHADSDFDGDIVFSTDNPTFIKCKYYDEESSLPITYQKTTVKKHVVLEKNLYKADQKSFNTKIGQITNQSTSFYDLLYKYKNDDTPYGKKCYDEIIERLKLTRYAQGQEIDHAKGVVTDPYPSYWINRQHIGQNESMIERENKNFLNDVCANKKPLFFKDRYQASKTDDKAFKDNLNLYSIMVCDQMVGDIQKTSQNKNEKMILDQYNNYSVLTDYGSPMNLVHHYMTENLKTLKKDISPSNLDIVNLLKTNIEPLDDFSKINIIKNLCDKWFDEKEELKKGLKKDYNNIDQYSKIIRERAIMQFENREEIANYVVEVCYIQKYHRSKSFAWNVFGEYLIENLIKNTGESITLPIVNPEGDIEYLYENYKLEEVVLNVTDI